MLAKLAPSTHTSGSNSAIFEAAATRQFFVHALRTRTEDAAQRRDVAGPGRLVDAEVASGCRAELRCEKNCNFQGEKPCEEVYFGPKRWLFFLENIQIHFQSTGFGAA